jgi:alpha-glucosidase
VPLPWSGQEPPFGFSTIADQDAGAGAGADMDPVADTGSIAGAEPKAEPWLPQPKAWKDLSVETQTGDPESMLELYRATLALRRTSAQLGDGPLTWLPAPDGVLAFARGGGDGGGDGDTAPSFVCVVNLSGGPVELPVDGTVALCSGALESGMLPDDTAVWLVR